MMADRENASYLARWLSICLPKTSFTLQHQRKLKRHLEREVWECTLETCGISSAVIANIFKAGSCESVNTNLSPAQTMQKCVMAMTELPEFGIPAPRVLGYAVQGNEAAMISRKIDTTAWEPRVRIQAAVILARLHTLDQAHLSAPLRELLDVSDPREERTTNGCCPYPSTRTLVHGDFFSANLLPTTDGVYVIDWETFGYGDSMWDLGFLIGADKDLPADEIEAVIETYASHAPVDKTRLQWHLQRWHEFWQSRKRPISW